ncbi:MAG: FHA domain-containing protein [Sedimenticolaceae bacterium]
MAALIIEIVHRNGGQYYRVDKPAVRVGRALDNDIILSDPSVSPYHFIVRRNAAGQHELHSLADENGIRIGRRQIRDPILLEDLPLVFDAGRTRIRILHPNQPVAETRLISCRNAGSCLFAHWGWALFLFAVLTLLSAGDNYLSTYQTLSWDSFWSDQLIIMSIGLGLSIGLLTINRITSQRWDFPASLSFVSLALIVAFLIDQAIAFADYFFTSPLPGFITGLVWTLFLIPMALGWFLIRLNHGNNAASILFVILLLSPSAYVQLREIINHYDLMNDFSKKAYYDDNLYPWDQRLKRTISIDEFAQNSMRILPSVPDER